MLLVQWSAQLQEYLCKKYLFLSPAPKMRKGLEDRYSSNTVVHSRGLKQTERKRGAQRIIYSVNNTVLRNKYSSMQATLKLQKNRYPIGKQNFDPAITEDT